MALTVTGTDFAAGVLLRSSRCDRGRHYWFGIIGRATAAQIIKGHDLEAAGAPLDAIVDRRRKFDQRTFLVPRSAMSLSFMKTTIRSLTMSR